jgi:hypothetical protein
MQPTRLGIRTLSDVVALLDTEDGRAGVRSFVERRERGSRVSERHRAAPGGQVELFVDYVHDRRAHTVLSSDQPLSSGDKPAGDACGPRPSPRLTRSPNVAGMTSQATLCDLFAATAAERHGDLALRAANGAVNLSWGEYTDQVECGNQRLARAEQIKDFVPIAEDWAAGGDELTPTMNLKRKPIAEMHANEIENLYGGG